MTRLHIISGLLLLIMALFSLQFGAVDLSFVDLASALTGKAEETTALIIFELRIPRLLLALFVGAGLGISGAALQGLLRNPLADPGVLGISAASSMGAVLAIHYGLTSLFSYALPLAAMLSGFLATAALFFITRREASHLTIILLGVAISSLCGAMTSLLISFAPSPVSMQEMVMWMLGSLENRSLTDVYLAGPFILIGMIMIFWQRRPLTSLTLGEDVAKSMGVDTEKTALMIILGSALIVGAGVAVSGIIGFIGLITPHIARPFVQHDPGKTLIPSALIGALLLGFADILVRLPGFYSELRIGVVTAFIGAPFFLWVIFKTRREMR
ncbi:iron ABC transporter permease [Temperatibacter marinus]|uniref:Iron ABC transporter permease n=1 Tax=Temperatibacter marinus TaxID=1456591 RepID=A0AA52HA84_9PROT|nr:iron ABC transporter permease [Temperatibacter marinus]WND03981.1 iron ABC transporter permease [Temperatibacter marinus]